MSAPRPLGLLGLKLAAGANLLVRLPLARLTGWEPDCWRRILGLGLRTEGAKFGLSAFGLDLFSDLGDGAGTGRNQAAPEAHFAERLASFLGSEPDAHWCLRHLPHYVERVPHPHADVVLASFAADGTIEALQPFLGDRNAIPAQGEIRRCAEAAVQRAHAATRLLPEAVRPNELLRQAVQASRADAPQGTGGLAEAYVRRLLCACLVSFESLPFLSPARFSPPDFRIRRSLGGGFLNVIARLSEDGGQVDTWWQIHHTAADGAPMQEMLSRLERAWGFTRPTFPADNPERPPFFTPLPVSAEERPLWLGVDFVDFAPLLRWRAEQNARRLTPMGYPLPTPAALLWWLAQQPGWGGHKFATAMDVPPTARWARAVDLGAIFPGDYLGRTDGLEAFARDYLGLVASARNRSTPSRQAMRLLALLPPALAARVLAADPGKTQETFGEVGLSVLKEASVFSAAIGDTGWDHGFFAIGGMGLPTTNGQSIGAVTVKGEAEAVRAGLAAVRAAARAGAGARDAG